ncbi:MAG TPA: DUF4097 family beta strand repeat-containing protein [Vicinamibacterales bacterium]|nr:DUF4097 family beta strand repeat-containing protein [Vicinamibacterales bacterium]
MATLRLVQIFAIVIAGASIGCSIDVQGSQTSTREEKQFTVSATEPVDLKIQTFDGLIAVRSWDKNEVLVEIERRGPDQASAEALTVNQSQEGNRIVIEAPSPGSRRSVIGFGNWVSQSVNFTVTVPRRVQLGARTGDGFIEVRDLEGTVDVNSGDGRITASNVNGQLQAHTGDGQIRIDDVTGRVEADSGDGTIEIAGLLNELTVRTGDGSVRVDAADGSSMKGDWRVTTGDGRILMRVPTGFNAEVDASTGDGTVRVEGVSNEPSDRDESERRRVVGRLGSGGATLQLRSGDGSIEVSR